MQHTDKARAEFEALFGEQSTPSRYVSPFEEGARAARSGTPWTNCPYAGAGQEYEMSEWLRGHQQRTAVAAVAAGLTVKE